MSEVSPTAIQLARLEVEVKNLTATVSALAEDVKVLTAALNQNKGGVKAVVAMASIGGAIAGFIASLVKIKLGGP